MSAKATLTGKVQEDKKLGCDPRDNGSKGDRSLALFKDNYMHEEMRKCGDKTLDLTKQKFEEKKASHLHDNMNISHVQSKTTIYWQKKTKRKQKLL